ncbi:hypothetical protein MJT46_017299 [Ovis ammon polii x Ovis aries]|nr:hypothetical protein MJT46_017299 [Ovis ammon polii x Ovis aries]
MLQRELHGMAAVLSEKKVEVFDNRNILKNSKEEKDLVSHGFQLSYFNGEVHLPNLEHNWAGIPGFFHGQEMLFLPVTSRNPEKMLSRVYRSSVAINAFVSYSKHRQKSRIPNGEAAWASEPSFSATNKEIHTLRPENPIKQSERYVPVGSLQLLVFISFNLLNNSRQQDLFCAKAANYEEEQKACDMFQYAEDTKFGDIVDST